MRASKTFDAGPDDPRAARRDAGPADDLSPTASCLPPRCAGGRCAGGGRAIARGARAARRSAPAVVGRPRRAASAAAASPLLARGFGPYTDFPSSPATWPPGSRPCIARRRPGAIAVAHGRRSRHGAVRCSLLGRAAAFLKLLVLLHPDMPVGDAMFHAHRFPTVVDGNLFFTSIAPGNYQFPYAPGLYVFGAAVCRSGDTRRGGHGAAADRS